MTDESFTAIHFAAYHGNVKLIRFLMEKGADPLLTSSKHINPVHVAAQGDQPAALAFFIK